MRVLFLNPAGDLGGAEISLLNFMVSLRSAAPDWQFGLIAGCEGEFVTRAAALGVEVQVVRFPPSLARLGDAAAGGPAGNRISRFQLMARVLKATPHLNAYRRRLRRAVARWRPDLIHTNGFKMHVLGIWTRPRSTPVVWHIHDYVSMRPLMGRLLQFHAAQCSIAVCNSRSTAVNLSSVCGPGLKVRVVHNGVDVERFSPRGPVADLDALAGMLPPAPGTVRIGLIATLARWKGHELFLEALSKLPANLPFRAYVIGDAVYQTAGSQYGLPELRHKAAERGLADRTGFTGFLPEPAAAIRALDILVHASTQPEPFGLVIAEGMSCGRAVIASKAGGALEILNLSDGAMGHEPGNADDLARCMERLARDPELRANLGRSARRAAERFFDRGRLADDLIPVYLEASGMPAPEPRSTKCA